MSNLTGQPIPNGMVFFHRGALTITNDCPEPLQPMLQFHRGRHIGFDTVKFDSAHLLCQICFRGSWVRSDIVEAEEIRRRSRKDEVTGKRDVSDPRPRLLRLGLPEEKEEEKPKREKKKKKKNPKEIRRRRSRLRSRSVATPPPSPSPRLAGRGRRRKTQKRKKKKKKRTEENGEGKRRMG